MTSKANQYLESKKRVLVKYSEVVSLEHAKIACDIKEKELFLESRKRQLSMCGGDSGAVAYYAGEIRNLESEIEKMIKS